MDVHLVDRKHTSCSALLCVAIHAGQGPAGKSPRSASSHRCRHDARRFHAHRRRGPITYRASFRSELWPGHKTSAGVEPELLAQCRMLESFSAAGIVVWPMVEFEADDALAASMAVAAARDARVERVIICTPDKISPDVCAAHVSVQLNRRTRASP